MSSTDPVCAVSVISTGSVEIHPEQVYGSAKPLYWWLLTSRRWLPARPINVSVIEHADGLALFDTGELRSTDKVLALAERMPGLVVLPAHDPRAARRLLAASA